jgi:hypothetical protein
MVERRPPQPTQQPTQQPGHEDTVAIPVNRPAAPSNAAPANGAAGNGKVLPPMPTEPPKEATPQGRSATPPPPPPSAKPKVAAKAPTTAAPKAAVTPTPTPAAGTPVAAPEKRPPVTPMPVVPEVDRRAERQAERDAKAAERAALRQAKDAEAAARKAADSKDAPRSRRARLRMTRIDPWSVMKTAFLLSIALGIVIVISVFMVWSVLDAADVWSSINQTVRDVTGETATPFDIEDYLGTRRVVGFSMIVAAVDVVLLTAIATLGAFLYNMSASLLGGVEVTLAEDK